MKPLSGLRVLDLSQRLPGPYAGMLLSRLGAEVIKLEDSEFKDAFLEEKLAAIDDSFVDWYKELNQNKKLVRLSFSQGIQEYIANADIILSSMPKKVAEKFGLTKENLPSPCVLIELSASQKNAPMHDLNALSEAGFLELHVTKKTPSPASPPLLPFAGMSFGQHIALTALALHRQAQRENKPLIFQLFLYEEVLKLYRPLWSENLQQQNRTKFLHNGKYPCYCLYRNKDGDWLAVAAVEEKFWTEFVTIFGLTLQLADRFSTDPKVFENINTSIAARSTAEIERMLLNKDICVSLIRPKT
ncbi:MAG: CoA transferase [Bacteriovoracaceae bacterium]|nr:CoA transferase [Bacteriovoracaceae bacterium]